MNTRLSKIASLIEPGIGFADIGTDHGYIPIYMARNGYDGAIIASDINRGPLECAITNARQSGLSHRIKFVLCDGLSGVDNEAIDTVIIAGMGGDLICRILDEADWICSGRYRLILQPMTKSEVLRYWLVNNGFIIDGEYHVKDSDKLYQIVTARFTGENTRLSDAELFCGAADVADDHELYIQRAESLIMRFQRSIEGMTAGGREAYKIEYLKEILAQLTELREKYDNS